MRRWPPRSVPAPKLCSALVLLGARAFAQPNDPAAGAGGSGPVAAPLQLSWSSSEPGCDGSLVAPQALQMVELGLNPPHVEAHAEVTRVGPTWTVKLEIRSENQTGTRVVSGETCKEIQDAVALLLSMILESEVDAAPSAAPQLNKPPASTPPSQPPSTPLSGVTPINQARPETAVFDEPEDEETPSEPGDGRTDFGLLLRLHGGASVGLQPGVGVGFGAAAGVHWYAWDFAVAASYSQSTRTDIEGGPGYVEIGRVGLGVRGCFTALSAGDLDVAGCVLPELTLFQFASFAIDGPRHGDPGRVLLSGTAALEFRHRLFGPHISAVLSSAVTWEKTQPFHVNLYCDEPCEPMEPTRVHETSGVGGRLEIGLDARF